MADVEVDEHPRSHSLSGTAETEMAQPVTKTSLSPEKSLFGNSADKLRESDLEAITSNGNTSLNGKEKMEASNGDDSEKMEVDEAKVDEDSDNKDSSMENKMDLSLEDKKGDESHDKSKVVEKPDAPKDDIEIEDNANEEPFVRKETTPLTEKEDKSAVDESALDEKVPEEEQTVEPPKEAEKEEAAEEEASTEKEAEAEAPSGRRSSRRSTAATPKQATPKATPQNTKKAKGTPASDKQDTEEKEEEMEEGKVEDEKGESEATPTRRTLRTPKSEPKPAKTPPSKAKKQEVDTEEATTDAAAATEEPTPNRRRSTRAVVKKEEVAKVTPAKAIKKEPEEAKSAKGGRGRKRPAAKEEEEGEEESEETTEVKAKAPAKKAKKEEETEPEEPEKKTTPRRASARSKSAATTPSTAKKGKATPKSAKKTPKEEPEDVEMESEEDGDEQEEEEEAAPKAAPKTPKRAPPKRGSATEKRASKQRKRRASEAPADPNDPFNFDAKKNEAPVLFKSVQVERQSYGNMKFFKASESGSPSKYASMEKNATERRSLMPEPSAASTPGSSKGGRTPATKKTPASTKRGKQSKKAAAEEVEGSEETKEEEKPTPKPKTPKAEAVAKPPKVEEQAPVLTAEEQIVADDESNAHFHKGARVFAKWGKEYYSAIVDDIDGLGRYKVFYTEDQSVRNIPKAGIIPLHLITEGSQVSVLGEEDEDEDAGRPIFNGKVVSVPSIKNAEEWYAGLYSIEITSEELPDPETKDIQWFNIYFTEAQYKQIIKKVKNPTAVDEGNVIDSGRRSTRRSTAAVATPTTTTTTTTTPRAKPGPKAGAKKAEKAAENDNGAEAQVAPAPAAVEEEEEFDLPLNDEDKFFEDIQFILTSANRSTGPPPFTKKEVRKQIENHGGSVIENFDSRDPDLKAYLIADTFYRTHKYLTALSLSLPTVSYRWIEKCVEEKKLVDMEEYMLDAGDDETSGEIYKWKDIKGKVLVGKKVGVYSWFTGSHHNTNNIEFVDIWAPIAENLGAEIVKFTKQNLKEIVRVPGAVDYFICDDNTSRGIVNAVNEGGGVPVSSEWCIQTVIKGEIAPTTGNESYILKAD